MAKQPVVAYWLPPALCAAWPGDSMRRIRAAHLTVHVADATPTASPKDVRALVDAAAEGVQPIGLTPAGIGYSETFTKALFVRFEGSRTSKRPIAR